MLMRAFALGVALWAGGTFLLRAAGELLLSPVGPIAAATRITASVIGFALAARLVSRRIPTRSRAACALALMLPTLVLDGFVAVFFVAVFRHAPADAAGSFAGWMMGCCAGVAVGALWTGA